MHFAEHASPRTSLTTSQWNRDITDLNLQQTIVTTEAAVRLAYLNLVGAIEGRKVADERVRQDEVASYAMKVLEAENRIGAEISKEDAFRECGIPYSHLDDVFAFLEEPVSMSVASLNDAELERYEEASRRGDEGLPDRAPRLGPHGDVLEVRVVRGEPPRRRDGLVEAGVDPPVPRDVPREGVGVGPPELRELAPLEDEARQRPEAADRELLEDVRAGRVALRLRRLPEDGVLQLLEKDAAELRRRADVEPTPARLRAAGEGVRRARHRAADQRHPSRRRGVGAGASRGRHRSGDGVAARLERRDLRRHHRRARHLRADPARPRRAGAAAGAGAGPRSGWTFLMLLGPAFVISPGLLQKAYGAAS